MRRRRDERNAGLRVPEPRQHLRHLEARQLTALAGLGTLGDLDLDLSAIEQVLGGDAKAARGDLLDRRGRVVAVPARDMARWVLAALAAVGLGADTVHGDRECLVVLGSEGAQRGAGRYQP